MIIICLNVISCTQRSRDTCGRTEGIMWRTRPGKGDFPVGQFDAQNLLPKGSGRPSLASSAENMLARRLITHDGWEFVGLTLVYAGEGESDGYDVP